MTYVPIVPPTPAPPPSPRTRELAGLLSKVLEEYKKAHPATTSGEVKAAIRLAQLSSRSGNPAGPALAVSLGLGLLVAAVFGGVLFLRAGGDVEISGIMPMLVFGLIVFIGLLAVLVKAMSR